MAIGSGNFSNFSNFSITSFNCNGFKGSAGYINKLVFK